MTTNQRIAAIIAGKVFDLVAQSGVRSVLKSHIEQAAFEALAIVEADAARGGLLEALSVARSGDELRAAAGELLKSLDPFRATIPPGKLTVDIKRLETALLAELLK
jgi:hypothetical protein